MAEMAEVIAFLIEHYQDFDDCPPPDDLGQILEDVGFDDVQINNALMLLAVLSDNKNLRCRLTAAMLCGCTHPKSKMPCRTK